MDISILQLEGENFQDYSKYIPLLPLERRDRIAQYRSEKSKLVSLAAGLLLQNRLSHYGISDFTLRYNSHGKPYSIKGPFFSISHSGDLVCCAVHSDEIGLDVEIISRARINVAQRSFSIAEMDKLQSQNNSPSEFCRIWTRKEAYLKYLGCGIAKPLKGFCTFAPKTDALLQCFRIENYWLTVCSAKREIPDFYYTTLNNICK